MNNPSLLGILACLFLLVAAAHIQGPIGMVRALAEDPVRGVQDLQSDQSEAVVAGNPQAVERAAAVLAAMPPSEAAEVLGALDDAQRAELVAALSRLEGAAAE